MSKLSLEYLKENTCSECRKRFRATGYILCVGCLNGFPRELDSEDINRIREWDALNVKEEKA